MQPETDDTWMTLNQEDIKFVVQFLLSWRIDKLLVSSVFLKFSNCNIDALLRYFRLNLIYF